MAIPRPEFVYRPDRLPTPCDVCHNAIETWNLTTFVGLVPVISICAECVTAIAKVVIATPAALQAIGPQERNQLGRALRASAGKDFEKAAVKQSEDDNAIAKRLLS